MIASRSSAGMRPCRSATRRSANAPARERLEHRRRRLEVGLLRLLDHRVDDVRLSSLRPARRSTNCEHALARRLRPRSAVATGCRPGGRSSRMLRSRSPYSVSASERGIGVAVISSTSGRLALGAERLALLDAEAVLLVDDGEPELAERRRLLHQRVRADDEQRLAGSRGARRPRVAPSPTGCR